MPPPGLSLGLKVQSRWRLEVGAVLRLPVLSVHHPQSTQSPLLQRLLQVGRAHPGCTHFLPRALSDPCFLLAGIVALKQGSPPATPSQTGRSRQVWLSARRALTEVRPRCLPCSLLNSRLCSPASPETLSSISSEPIPSIMLGACYSLQFSLTPRVIPGLGMRN